jgi:hypothetical protein
LCELGTVTKSGTKGMIINIPKNSVINVLARVVKHDIKHDIYSFARTESIHWGGTRKIFVGSQWQGSDVRTDHKLESCVLV